MIIKSVFVKKYFYFFPIIFLLNSFFPVSVSAISIKLDHGTCLNNKGLCHIVNPKARERAFENFVTKTNNDLASYGNPTKLMQGVAKTFATTQSLASGPMGSANYDLFAFYISGGVGLEGLSTSDTVKLFTDDSFKEKVGDDFERDIENNDKLIGSGAAINVYFGLKSKALGFRPGKKLFGFINMRDISFGVKGVFLPYKGTLFEKETEIDLYSLGGRIHWAMVNPKSAFFYFFRWNGLNVTSGMDYYYSNISTLQYDHGIKNKKVGKDESKDEITFDGPIALGIQSGFLIIPLEIKSSVTLFWIVNLFGGVGLDFISGKSDLNIEGYDNIVAKNAKFKDYKLTITNDESSSWAIPVSTRVFMGLGLHFGPLQVDLSAYYSPLQGSGAVAGVGVIW